MRWVRGVLVAGCVLGLVACSTGDGPVWRSLTFGYRPAQVASEAVEFADPTGRPVRLVREGAATWIETVIRRDQWRWNGVARTWETDVSLRGLGKPESGAPQRLFHAGGEYTYFPPTQLVPGFQPLADHFLFMNERLRLKLDDGVEPEPQTTLALYAGRGGASEHGWRVKGQRFSGEALPVWPEESLVRRVELNEPQALHFATVQEPAHPDAEGTLTFLVRANGREVFRHTHPDAGEAAFRWHRIDLPAHGATELSFEVEGPLAFTGFFAPTLGPVEVGDYGRRPRAPSRPDIVLFQADTFRADNMGTFGSTHEGLTPVLDALAERGLAYERAYSTSSYTLPAHASLFTGLYPRQAGVVGPGHALVDGVKSIAQLLQRAGYRTGAITDAVMVSQKFGLDRGFSWFDEHRDGLGSTLERVRSFLEADDGRPVFLFVQSYRVHAPYEVSEETRRTWGTRLGIEGRYEEIVADYHDVAKDREGPRRTLEELRSVAARFRSHYLGGVHDFDREFQAFVDEFEQRGFFSNGYVLFTSDHGEGFAEHGEIFHSGDLYEEQIRVPLLVLGQGVEPGRVSQPVSLVDVAPTLARWASVEPQATWVGSPLTELPTQRPLFSFQCWGKPSDSTLAVIEGRRKLLSFEHPDALREGALQAFDLATDPGESLDLSSRETWPAQVLERWTPQARRYLEPPQGLRAADLDREKLEELDAMGYGGATGGEE